MFENCLRSPLEFEKLFFPFGRGPSLGFLFSKIPLPFPPPGPAALRQALRGRELLTATSSRIAGPAAHAPSSLRPSGRAPVALSRSPQPWAQGFTSPPPPRGLRSGMLVREGHRVTVEKCICICISRGARRLLWLRRSAPWLRGAVWAGEAQVRRLGASVGQSMTCSPVEKRFHTTVPTR